jgi:hypothetical protein
MRGDLVCTPSYFPLSAGTARLDARNQLLDHQGVPSGIDIRKVVETGIVPWINTGIAHRQAGIGQIGAGVVQAPMDCFVQALEAFAESWNA